MTRSTTGRRDFLKRVSAGAAAVSVTPSLAVAVEARRTSLPPFEEAWRHAPSENTRWQVVRDRFLIEPGYTYMNTAGLGPTPDPVIRAVDEASRRLEIRWQSVPTAAVRSLRNDSNSSASIRGCTKGSSP